MRVDAVRNVAGRENGRSSSGSLAALVDDLAAAPDASSEGDYYALAMLLVDAALADDAAGLDEAARSLQRLSGAIVRSGVDDVGRAERLGRARALMDCARWAVARSRRDPSDGVTRSLGLVAER